MEGGDALASPLSNGKPFPLFRGAKEEILILHSKIKYRSCNTPTRRHRDISQTKLRTSVLLRQRAVRLVLAFAICKSRGARARARGHYGTAILAFPLFFSPIRIWSSSGTRSLNRVGWGKKGQKERRRRSMEEKRRTWRDAEEKGRGIERRKDKRGVAEARICAR